MTNDFELAVEDVEISHGRYDNTIRFSAKHADVLDNFSVADIAAHFDTAELLDQIGVEECKEHFGLVEEE